MIKKTLSLLLTILMVLTMAIPTNAFAAENDYAGHWAEETIKLWLNEGRISGYPDGTFRPDGKVTRAEFVTMVNKLLDYTEKTDINFSDVNKDDWYYQEVQIAYQAGYITGVSEMNFAPNSNLTREQAAVIVARLMNLKGDTNAAEVFTDYNKISSWALELVGAAAKSEIIKGYTEDNTFRPQNSITRSEAVVTLNRTIESEDLTVDKAGTIVENKTVRNLYITENVGDGEVTLKNVTVTGELLVEGGGLNTVTIEDSKINKLTTNKADGKVRILLKGGSEVDLTSILSGATLEQEDLTGDGFADVVIEENANTNQTVTIKADIKEFSFKATIKVNIETGVIESIIIDEAAEDLVIYLGEDVQVLSAVVNTKVSFTGKGTIEKAEVNADGVTFEKKPTEIISAPPTTGGGGGGGGGSANPEPKTLNLEIELSNSLLYTNDDNYHPDIKIIKFDGIEIYNDDDDDDEDSTKEFDKITKVLGHHGISIKFKSENSTIVSVDEKTGMMTSHNIVGDTNIKVIASKSGYKNAEFTYIAEVIIPVDSVKITATTSTSISIGGTVQLKSTIYPDNATFKSVIWSTSDRSIATVDDTGLVTGVSTGTAIITVITDQGKKTDSVSIIVEDSVTSLIPISGVSIKGVDVVGSSLVAVDLKPSNATVNYQWQFSTDDGKAWNDIHGETSNIYELTDIDVSKLIRVKVIGTGNYIGIVTSDFKGPIVFLDGEFSNNAVTTKVHGKVDGYIVDVRLTDGATFENASVVVSLVDEDDNVMQKNTLKADHGLKTTSLTIPFDVKGTFDYDADGFWVVEGSVKGNYTVPSKVVIEVILGNGKELVDELAEIDQVKKVMTISNVNISDASTITFKSDVAGATIKWNGIALSEETKIGSNTITVLLMESGVENTLVIEKSEYKTVIFKNIVYTAPYDKEAVLGTWVDDRTPPVDWNITDGWISYKTNTAPSNNWYAWHGRKAITDNAVTDNWKVETEFELTDELLTRNGVRTSMWLNIQDEFGKNVDWSILQFKIDESTQTKGWQYWDASGVWVDIDANLPTTSGIYKLAIYYTNGNIVGYINGVEVFRYAKSDSNLTSVKEIIFNSYSFGESYEVKWKVPSVSYVDKYPTGTKFINTVEKLAEAINNQKDGETWVIKDGVYSHGRFDDITAGGQKGWYFPITANNLTIVGESKEGTIITSDIDSPNGNWASQTHISVWGNNVTIKNLTIRPKITTNKTIEVMGKDFTIRNVDFIQREDAPYEFAGSFYFNPQNVEKDIGTVLIEDVLINDAWISCGPTTVHTGTLELKNTTIDYRGSAYAPYGYGIISKNDGVIKVAEDSYFKVYVDDTIEDVQEFAIDRMPIGGTLILEEGRYYVPEELSKPEGVNIDDSKATIIVLTTDTQLVGNEEELNAALGNSEVRSIFFKSDIDVGAHIVVDRDVAIEGRGFKLTATDKYKITKENENGEKHLLLITGDNVKVNNLMVDSNSKAFGVTAFEADNIILNNITILNSVGSGLCVNGSMVTANTINTSGNAWGAINVDPGKNTTVPSVFILTGNGVLKESNQIWSDGTYVNEIATVTVDAERFAGYLTENNIRFWTNRELENVATITKDDKTIVYSTIQAAIDEAKSEDTILVYDGTYNGFRVNKDNITVKAVGEVVIIPVEFSGWNAGIHLGVLVESKGVVIDGVEVDRDTLTGNVQGIAGFKNADFTVINSEFTNLKVGINANSNSPDPYNSVNLVSTNNIFKTEVGIGGTENTILTATENTFKTTVEAMGLGGGVSIDGDEDVVQYLYSEAVNNNFTEVISGDYVVDYRYGTVRFDEFGNRL